jgi:hypothetical protein
MPGVGIPEIIWGTFEDEFGFFHVIPTIEKTMMAGHEKSSHCNCNPKLDRHPKRLIIVHRVIH